MSQALSQPPTGSILTKLLAAAKSRDQADDCRREIHLAFHEVSDRFVWITDGPTRVGLLDRSDSSLQWVAPHPGIQPIAPAEIPEIYHAPRIHGGWMSMQWRLGSAGGFWLLRRGEPPPKPVGMLKKVEAYLRPHTEWHLEPAQGDQLCLRAVHRFPGDARVRGEHRLRIGYDELADSYVAEVRASLRAADHYVAEVGDLFAPGAYDNRPDSKRYQSTIWSHPDGRFVSWPHNLVGYWTPGMHDPEGERRIAAGGFIGFFDDPYTNPVVDLLEPQGPMAAATCPNIYDEHLICLQPSRMTSTTRHWEVPDVPEEAPWFDLMQRKQRQKLEGGPAVRVDRPAPDWVDTAGA